MRSEPTSRSIGTIGKTRARGCGLWWTSPAKVEGFSGRLTDRGCDMTKKNGKQQVFDKAFEREAVRSDERADTACTALGVSVSSYYAWKGRDASLRQRADMVLLEHIRS